MRDKTLSINQPCGNRLDVAVLDLDLGSFAPLPLASPITVLLAATALQRRLFYSSMTDI